MYFQQFVYEEIAIENMRKLLKWQITFYIKVKESTL